MTEFPIGIDLGTCTSEIAYFEAGAAKLVPDPSDSKGRSPIVPSLVALNKREEIVVGRAALDYGGSKDSHAREFKREMGKPVSIAIGKQSFRPEELSARILMHLKMLGEQHLNAMIKKVVVSVPANFAATARTATHTAAQIAGLEVVRLINEPTAAALAFGINNIDLDARIAVFDFGGGTLDVTVLQMIDGVLDVSASDGDTELGGKEFDAAVKGWLVNELERQHPGARLDPRNGDVRLREAAERLKVDLSASTSACAVIPYIATRNGEPVDLEAELSRAEFERLGAPLLDRTRACVRKALAKAKTEPRQVDRILLVGGTTYIPCVRRLVAEIFGQEPKAEVPPDLAVAMGAAVHAASAAGVLAGPKDVLLLDGCPIGLGIDIYREVGGRRLLTYEPLIALNEKIPYRSEKTYSLLRPDQTAVNFRVLQDRTGKARLASEGIPTGVEGDIVGIPPTGTDEPHSLVVEFSYDSNGEVKVRARIKAIGLECRVELNDSALRMSDTEVRKAQERMKSDLALAAGEFWRAHPDAALYTPLIDQAQSFLSRLPAGERELLAGFVSQLKQALAAGSGAEASRLRQVLTEALLEAQDGAGAGGELRY